MSDLCAVYVELKAVMQSYAEKLDTKMNTASELFVDTKYIQKNKKPLFFGAVQVKKNYVSYHLIPVYVAPGILAGVSARLKKRMQGWSCFYFTEIDRPLFKELAALTKAVF